MKALPCIGLPSEPAGIPKCPRGASATLPSGLVYTTSRRPEAPYRCATCGRKTRLTPQQYAALPNLTFKDLERLALTDLVTRDLEGAGVTPEQLQQALGAGVELETLIHGRPA